MTPEERFERIERNLERMGERLDRMGERLDGHIDFVGRSLEEQNKQIEKNTAGVRDLIVVSRTVLTSIEEMRKAHEKSYGEWTEWATKWSVQWTAKMDELREAQAATDEKLNILLDTVDRIIRNRNGNKEPS